MGQLQEIAQTIIVMDGVLNGDRDALEISFSTDNTKKLSTRIDGNIVYMGNFCIGRLRLVFSVLCNIIGQPEIDTINWILRGLSLAKLQNVGNKKTDYENFAQRSCDDMGCDDRIIAAFIE
jgi:hypothetical protein